MATLNANALCSLADVKETLGITNSSKDNLIIRKINQASQMIEDYCQRKFVAARYTEVYDGSLTDQLVLRQHPVSLLSTVEARNTSLNDNSFSVVPGNDYFLDSNAGVIEGISSFWGHYDRWQITYDAGYTTIPSDLAEACATLAAHLFSSSIGGGGAGNSASMVATRVKEGQREIQYASSNASSGAGGNDALYASLGILGTLQYYADTVLSGNR